MKQYELTAVSAKWRQDNDRYWGHAIRLHAGKSAKIVFEVTKTDLEKGKT